MSISTIRNGFKRAWLIGLLTGLGLFPSLGRGQTIQVQSAVWAGKDVTAAAGTYCNGKPTCNYKVSTQYIGAPQNPVWDFSLAWTCGDPNLVGELKLPHDATAQPPLAVTCPFGPTVTTRSLTLPPGAAAPAAATAPAVVRGPVPQASFKDPRDALKFQSSFHSRLMNNGPDNVKSNLPAACVQAVREVVTQGQNFLTQSLDQFVLPLAQFPHEASRTGVFYHSTKAPEVGVIAKSSSFEEIFLFLRTVPTGVAYEFPYLWFFHVAADVESSRVYGNLLARVHVSPNSLVLMTSGGLPGQDAAADAAKASIEDELIRKFPNLSHCKSNLPPEPWENGILVLLAAEAKGVSLISQFGVGNRYNHQPGPQWFQILGPWAIQKMEVQ